jgi:S1-C subfamily serine protease
MGASKSTFLLVLAVALAHAPVTLRAQSPLSSSPSASELATTMPASGQALEPENSDEAALHELPLPRGVSFQALGEVVSALAHASVPTRGAREIAAYRQAAPAVVLVRTREGSGSGVVLQSGLILTNRHIVKGIVDVQIVFKPSNPIQGVEAVESRAGKVTFVDAQRDLALISADSMPADFKYLKIAPRDDIEVGTEVYAIGHPLGYNWTFTEGVVSGIRQIDRDGETYTAIQTQTPINPGNSGGPLLNAGLEVVGINTWARDISMVEKVEVASQDAVVTRPAQGLNFAVSARDIRDFLNNAASGKLVNLALQIPEYPGCTWQLIFNGRTRENNARLKTFSSTCDGIADAWEVFPDDKSKAVQLHIDPFRVGKSSIIVLSNPRTRKWETSYWDFFRDQSYAIIGRHEDGNIKPTRFEFAHN